MDHPRQPAQAQAGHHGQRDAVDQLAGAAADDGGAKDEDFANGFGGSSFMCRRSRFASFGLRTVMLEKSPTTGQNIPPMQLEAQLSNELPRKP